MAIINKRILKVLLLFMLSGVALMSCHKTSRGSLQQVSSFPKVFGALTDYGDPGLNTLAAQHNRHLAGIP